jgi:hypothetical protein
VNRDVVIVLVSAVVATFNPTLLAAVAVMLLLPHPRRLMTGYLLGAYTSSIAAGLVIVFTLQGSSVVGTSTHLLSPGGELAIGLCALSFALVMATGHDTRIRGWRARRKQAHAAKKGGKAPWQLRMLGKGSAVITFAVGAAMSFPGAGYVNALDHISHLNPPTVSILVLVLYFCFMQQILLEGALLASTVAADRTQAAVVAVKGWFASHGRQVAMVGLAAVGALLAVRGVVTIG